MIRKLLSVKGICAAFLLAGFTVNAQNGLNFDGTNDYIQTTYAGITGNNARTVEAWIKTSTNTTGNQNVIVDWGNLTPNGSRFTLNLLNNVLRIEIGGSGLNGSTLLNDGEWHHVAVSYNPTAAVKVRLYVDGVQDGAGNFTLTPSTLSTINVRIGQRVADEKFFQGTIDEVRIWNTARTADEIADNMNNEFCNAPAGLTAYYKLNEGTAGASNTGITTAYNAAGTNNGTLNGFALSGTTSNWVTGQTLTSVSGINTEVTFNEVAGTLTAAQTGATYQWIDCNNENAEIEGADQAIFTPATSGNYAVVITKNSCTETSDCMEITLCDVDNTITFNEETLTLTANQAEATYQWVNCDNENQPIEGADAQSFTPEVSGNYAVIVTLGECSATSDCQEVDMCNIDDSFTFDEETGTLTATMEGAEYQWIDCNNENQPIEGADEQSFTPEVSGSYAVIVTIGECTNTSSCQEVTVCNVDDSFTFDAETGVLTATMEGAAYQWVDCNNNNEPIEGADAQSFTPEVTGSYAVIVTAGECSNTSSCQEVTVLGINDYSLNGSIKVYPNPTNGMVNIALNALYEDVNLIVYNITGQVIYKKAFDSIQNLTADISGADSGIYFFQVKTANGKSGMLKVVKN